MKKATTSMLSEGKILVKLEDGKGIFVVEKNVITLADGERIKGNDVEIRLCEEGDWPCIVIHRDGKKPEFFQPQNKVKSIEIG